jgi:hypothetical protein
MFRDTGFLNSLARLKNTYIPTDFWESVDNLDRNCTLILEDAQPVAGRRG